MYSCTGKLFHQRAGNAQIFGGKNCILLQDFLCAKFASEGGWFT